MVELVVMELVVVEWRSWVVVDEVGGRWSWQGGVELEVAWRFAGWSWCGRSWHAVELVVEEPGRDGAGRW